MIEGLQAIRLRVPDLPLAVRWYTQALEVEPYRVDHAGATFFLDGSLLCLELEAAMADEVPLQNAAYWRVDQIQPELLRLCEPNAAPFEAVAWLDADTQFASVLDPFGNVFGLIQRHDPATLKARIQRVAEKSALRNVRETLDEISAEDAKKRAALKITLTLACAGFALIALLVWDMVRR